MRVIVKKKGGGGRGGGVGCDALFRFASQLLLYPTHGDAGEMSGGLDTLAGGKLLLIPTIYRSKKNDKP